jgi:hypothetical protein
MQTDHASEEAKWANTVARILRHFTLWVSVGIAPAVPLWLSWPVLSHFGCKVTAVITCASSGWPLALAQAVHGLAWLLMLSVPVAVICLLAGLLHEARQFVVRLRRMGVFGNGEVGSSTDADA